MNLPAWVKRSKPFDTPDDVLLILEALSIAWEALDATRDGLKVIEVGKYADAAASYRVADKTMRRISELGK